MNTSSVNQVKDNGTLRIWFAEGLTFTEANAKLKRGWWRRHPAWLVQLLGTSLTGWLFDTRGRHVLLEHNGLVLDVCWTQSSCHRSLPFHRTYRGIIGCFEIPTNDREYSWVDEWMGGNLMIHDRSTVRALVSNLTMLCTFGMARLFREDTCVDVALGFLRRAGVTLPRKPWEPAALCRYLLENQHEWKPGLSAVDAATRTGSD